MTNNNVNSYNSSSTKPIFHGTQIVWYILAVVEILLAFRFILKMSAANSTAGFTNFIYSITWPLTEPFIAVFRVTKVQGNVFEWTTILAGLVYWIVAFGIIKIFMMSKTVSTPEAAAHLDKQEDK